MGMQEQMRTLFAYHWHTTRRLLAAAAALTPEELHARGGYGHGSIHEILFHILRTDHNWRRGVETGRQLPPPVIDDFPDLGALEQGFNEEEAAWTALLDGLNEAQISEAVEMTSLQGETRAVPRWRIFQHLILHGMQHHSELGHLLTAAGHSPGDIDFMFYHAS